MASGRDISRSLCTEVRGNPRVQFSKRLHGDAVEPFHLVGRIVGICETPRGDLRGFHAYPDKALQSNPALIFCVTDGVQISLREAM